MSDLRQDLRQTAPHKEIDVVAEKKRVLVVSFDFPPNRTSAVYRMTGLTRALPQLGWQPTILTTRISESDQEPKLLEKVPREVRVVRSRYLSLSGWERSTATVAQSLGGLRSTPADTGQPRLDRWLRAVGRLVRSAIYFPDHSVGWIPFALAKAIQLHRERPFDAIYTTTPPRAASVVGLLFKLLYGVPWVCEFMDPWYPPEGRIRRTSENWLQRRLMSKADRIVVMVKEHAHYLSRRFHASREKFAVVRNGFFEEDFLAIETAKNDCLAAGYVHLSHFGNIYQGNAGKFFPALAELLRECPRWKERLRVNIIGYPDLSVLRYAKDSELKDIIQIRGFLQDRMEVLKMMRSSHCLLLFWGQPEFSRLAVAGKTYDYLRVGRPILAVTHEGGVQELVKEGRAGWVVPPDNTEAIKQALKAVLEYNQNGRPTGPPRPEFVAQFRWDQQAKLLAQALDEARS